MRTRLLLAIAALSGIGCRSTPPPAGDGDNARIRELETRVARLETQAKAADLEDEVLALEVERAGLLVTYEPSHPAVVKVDERIRELEETRAEENRARRERMLRRLEAERRRLLVTYTPEHGSVQRLDAQIAFLKADAG